MVMAMAEPILGIDVPDTRPVFLAILLVHVLAGMTAVVTGAAAALSKKHPGRHPRAGRCYLWALGAVFITAAALAVLRWPHDLHLLILGCIAFATAMVGWLARRHHQHGWARRHILGMGISYIAMLTAFYADNGPQLPLWNQLPTWAFWILPTVVGAPIVARALVRHGSGRSNSVIGKTAPHRSTKPRSDERA